MFKNSLVHL